MFENVIGQEQVIGALRSHLSEANLPRSLLFHGPEYAGKLTTALELARVLTCEVGSAAWDCGCASCALHRHLSYPDMLLMGSRSFLVEITACADVLRRIDKPSTRFLFIRAVRKLLKRFDSVLWEGSESRLSTVTPLLATVGEVLEGLHPGEGSPAGKISKRALSEIVDACRKVEKSSTLDSVSVNQVRRAGFWAHTTSQLSRKIIIIENADRLAESARNAALKLLEEPPAEAYFILTTSSKEGVMPTLRSRLRPFRFIERDETRSQEVLQRIFREESGQYRTMREFFLAWQESSDHLRADCRRFVEAVRDREPSVLYEKAEAASFFARTSDRRSFAAFLEELQRYCRDVQKSEVVETADAGKGGLQEQSLRRYERWNTLIRHKMMQSQQLNQKPDILFESLFYEMRNC